MLDELILGVFVLGVPLLLFLGCGALQGFLASRLCLKSDRSFLALLPLLSISFLVIAFLGYTWANGWDGLIWLLAVGWSICACAGTALGWLTGWLLKRRREHAISKKNSL